MDSRQLGILEISNRMKIEFSDDVKKSYEYHLKCKKKWHENNRIKSRQCIKKYENTDKGKIAVKKRRATRERRVRKQSDLLPFIELHKIRQFYVNCPLGMVVDHIIPISRGGLHHISNLQYLPPLINFKKKDRLTSELTDCDWYHPYLKKDSTDLVKDDL